MGNKHHKEKELNCNGSDVDGVYKQKGDLNNQFGGGNLSGRSFTSVSSHHSTYSLARPWSRVSRRRWKESTLTLPYESSKTAWPVSQQESLFLPEFPLNSQISSEDFDIIKEISQGAFGKVYLAKKRTENCSYALKVLSKSKIIKENSLRQVKEEVQIQSACGHHPFIVNCPFRWQSRHRLYIVTDYIAGGELYTLLKLYRQLPVAVVQLYVAQIALALDFLHNAGVIYRDLKPENLLLDEKTGNIRLIDFGLSKWLPYGAKTRTICGTLQYIAPEVFSSSGGAYGHAADWWSLGIVACLMLTGEYPNTNHQHNNSTQSQSLLLPENNRLSVSERDLLLRLLQIDPAKRLRSLRTLQTIAFYHGFDFEAVQGSKVDAFQLLQRVHPDGPPQFEDREERWYDLEDFDSVITHL